MRVVRCLFFVALAAVLGAHAASDFKVGPDVPLDSLSIAAGTDNWLTVWRDKRDPNVPRITGAFVSKGGIVGVDFSISAAAGQPIEDRVQRATVAFDGTNFLVVWADARTGGTGVRGAILSPQGAVVVADFLIGATTRTTNIVPLVNFNATDYVVAWQDNAASGTGSQIYYARVSKIGQPGVRQTLGASSATVDQALEFLATGPASETLLLHQDLTGTVPLTRATRIGNDNIIAGPADGTFLFQKDFSATGFGSPIGVAYDGTQYNVLSSHGAQIDSTVFKTILRLDNTVLRSSIAFAEVGQGTTGLAEDNFPRTWFLNGEFFFVRNTKVSETAYHLVTKRVRLEGEDRDPNLPLIDSASQGVLNGAQASALGSKYIVVWMDGRRSGFQPAKQENIYATFIDGDQLGDITQGFLRASARAAPTIGSAPLKVFYGTGNSTGIIDMLRWDFGDGGSDTIGSATHTYENKGTYIAVLNLIRAGFIVRDFVRIIVDDNEAGAAGGPPQSVGGSLGPLTPGLEPDVFVTQLVIARQFTKANSDSLRIFGWFDPAALPVTAKDRTGALTIFGRTYTFKTDINGIFASPAGTTPVVRFAIGRFGGGFQLSVSGEDFTAAFAALGVGTDTVAKPGRDIVVPYTLTYDTLRQESSVTGNYLATAGKAGRLTYLFANFGKIGSGFMHVFNCKATETGEKGVKSHKFVVTGNTGLGGNAPVDKAATGRWRITFGNFTEDIPVSALVESNDVYAYNASKGKTGLVAFFYNKRNGAFGVSLKAVPAEGASPSGMPLGSSSVFRADMALALDFDTPTGPFQSSAFVRFGRNKPGSGKWKPR